MPNTKSQISVSDDGEAAAESTTGIGLALSGGGSRAIAFHLGCLRALNQVGLLSRVDVISTVSGGSVIGALYASHEGDFLSFETRAIALLKEGLVGPIWKTALTTRHGLHALLNWVLLLLVTLISFPILQVKYVLAGCGVTVAKKVRPLTSYLRRFESRTTLLIRALDSRWYEGKTLDQLSIQLMINACDLTHGSAFYFSPRESGSWRLGKLKDNKQPLAEAVAASAAYPLALPALDKNYRFTESSGQERTKRVSLTDGGVYDNTALSPFWPSREKTISIAVKPVNTIIACRAGYGNQPVGFSHFLFGRLIHAYSATQNRAENASIQRLFEQRNAGAFKHVILPFLGQNDDLLSHPPDNLVSAEEVSDYPTNFNAMADNMIKILSLRGEQLTKALLEQHAPILLVSGPLTKPSDPIE